MLMTQKYGTKLFAMLILSQVSYEHLFANPYRSLELVLIDSLYYVLIEILKKCQTAAMMKFENVVALHLKSNPKAFYSYMNSKRKIKAVISGIKDGDGNTLFNAEDINNELGNFLESTFVSETLDGMPNFKREYSSFKDISDVIFTSADVKFHFERLNV